jgi:uncharacterized protein YfdQ (DUF2303 family)
MPDLSEALQKLISTGKALAGVRTEVIESNDLSATSTLINVAVPDGIALQDVTDKVLSRLPAPRRRKGSLTMLSPKSLVDYVNRYVVQGQTAIFADSANRKVVAVLNYHEPTPDAIALAEGTDDAGLGGDPNATPAGGSWTAQWGDFRASYAFPLSRQWNAWKKIDGVPQGQVDLAHFLEDNIRDIADPAATQIPDSVQMLIDRLNLSLGAPARLLEVARGMEIRSTESVRAAINTGTGEQIVSYEQTHAAGGGNPTVNELRVPTAFLLAVPVFQNDAPYLLLCRLRYRKQEATVRWIVNIQGADAALEDAFSRGCDAIQEGTGVPLFFSEHPGAAVL